MSLIVKLLLIFQGHQTFLMANGSAMKNGSRAVSNNLNDVQYTDSDGKVENMKFPMIANHACDRRDTSGGNVAGTHRKNNNAEDFSNCEQIAEEVEVMKKSLLQIRNFIRQHEQASS